MDVTKPKASVIVDSNDIPALDDTVKIKRKGQNVYVVIDDGTKTSVGQIKINYSDKLSLSLLKADKTSNLFNCDVYDIKDDGIYILKKDLINANEKEPDLQLGTKDSTTKTKFAQLSSIKLVKWNYSFSKDSTSETVKLWAQVDLDDSNSDAVLSIKLQSSDGTQFDLKTFKVDTDTKDYLDSAKATLDVEYFTLSSTDPKVLYENKAEAYALIEVEFIGSKSNNALFKNKYVLLLKYNPLDPSKPITYVLDSVSASKGASGVGNVLAFADSNSSAAYVCNLDLDSNPCQKIYTSTNIAWIKVLNRKGNDVYLIIKDNSDGGFNYLIKYDLSSQNAEVKEKASGDVIANAPTFIKATDDNQDVMLVKDTKTNTYYLIDYNEKSIKKTADFPTGCGEDDLLNITSKGAALLYDKANQKVCYGSLKAGVYELYDGVSLRSYKLNLKTGDVTLLLENTASLYYEVCTFSSLDCSKSSTLTFIESNSKFIGKVGNKYKYISYEFSDNYTDVYIYKLIADDAKATINVDSFKYQNATGYEFKDVIKLDLDVLVQDPKYYYLFKERNN